MKQAILDYLAGRQSVSFSELEDMLPGFGGGDEQLTLRGLNVLLWMGLSVPANKAMLELIEDDKLELFVGPRSNLAYMMGSKMPQLPVARQIRKYKTWRWLPVTLALAK